MSPILLRCGLEKGILFLTNTNWVYLERNCYSPISISFNRLEAKLNANVTFREGFGNYRRSDPFANKVSQVLVL